MYLVLFAIYILSILTVIFIERKKPTDALFWVTIMILLPYVGTILYMIFGSTVGIKIIAFIRGKRIKEAGVDLSGGNVKLQNAEISVEDMEVMQFNYFYNGSMVTCYDNAEIFTTGKEHYERLFQDIHEAKECIYAEFYTIHNDIMGQSFVKALTEKAAEGVEVLVLCDFIANLQTPAKMFKPLKEAGGKVVRVKPYLTNFRSHRKIVAVDHKISYIGGMNIGKQYANMGKKKNPWRDTQVRLEGRCTSVLDEYFLTDWISAVKRKELNRTTEYIESLETNTYGETGNICQFIAGGVDNSKESAKMCYLSMIRSAKNVIRIQSPYFIPDPSVLDALKTAAASGVKIQLMIPEIKASFFLDPVTTYYAGELMEFGAEVYKYHGYIHAKTMVIDNELCCIGSVNMDRRSLSVNDEICGVFYKNEMAENYSRIYEEDISNCAVYTLEDFRGRSTHEKIQEAVFILFAPLM